MAKAEGKLAAVRDRANRAAQTASSPTNVRVYITLADDAERALDRIRRGVRGAEGIDAEYTVIE